MATRTSLASILLGALILAGTQRGDAVAPRLVSLDQDGAGSTNPVVLRIDRRDKMTPGQLNQLRGGSAMARELLVRVANLRDTILILRGDPALVVRSRLYGRSRFWVHSGSLFGYIQYQSRTAEQPGHAVPDRARAGSRHRNCHRQLEGRYRGRTFVRVVAGHWLGSFRGRWFGNRVSSAGRSGSARRAAGRNGRRTQPGGDRGGASHRTSTNDSCRWSAGIR